LDAWWVTLLREQQSDGFPDFGGAEASATIPISDQLISRVIAARLPPAASVRELAVRAHAGDELTIRVKLTKPAILPPFQVKLTIEQQPELPVSSVLILGVASQGLASFAVNALKFVSALPPGVRFDGRRFFIDLRTLLEQYGGAEALVYLTGLTIRTVEGYFVVQAHAHVPVARRP
jgi:hypothetical protein